MSEILKLQFPGIYAQLAKKIAEDLAYTVEDVFGALQIPTSIINDPNAFLNGEEMLRLLEAAQFVLPKNRPISFTVLEQFQYSTLGFLGLTVSSSENVESALEIIDKYYQYFLPSINMYWLVKSDKIKIQIESLTGFGDMSQTLIEIAFGAFDHIFSEPKALIDREINFAFEPVFPVELYQEFYGCSIKFNTAINLMTFDIDYLKKKTPTANSSMFKVFEQQLKEQYAFSEINFSPSTLARKILRDNCEKGIVLNREQLAGKMAVSNRTLTRKLKIDGSSYQVLLDEVRSSIARKMLVHSKKPISQIAKAIGIKDNSTFARAFKKWTGETPKMFREKRRLL